jgi:acetylornithine deacetylase
MQLDPVSLTRDLVAVKSVSRWSNSLVSDLVEERFREHGFETERLDYVDENGETKVSIVGRKGSGTGGLAFFSHTDTVPGQEEDWDPYDPVVGDGKVSGRGSCDMKGPLAATMAAAAAVDSGDLEKPVLVMATADEEVGGGGAKQVVRESRFFREAGPSYAVVAEPTQLWPVYAHKGGVLVMATARGRAAHTSTDLGTSANFLIAPFLAEMAELAKDVKGDPRYRNPDFDPPTNGFNMVFDDGGTRPNVSAARSTCQIGFRPMPGDESRKLMEIVIGRARAHGLEVETGFKGPFYVSPDADLVQLASRASGGRKPKTVPYGTDSIWIKDQVDELVVLGPGNIAQAHTVGEWISIEQLEEAVEIYGRMIREVCC